MSSTTSDVTAFGVIRSGRLHFNDRRAFDEAIRRFRDGAAVEVEVTQRRAARNVKQNRWYWGQILGRLAEHTGYSADDMHDICKHKFIPKRLAICDGNGEVVDEYVVGGSTRKMNTNDFAEYCDAIRQWAAETFDMNIPDPDPEWRSADAEFAGHGSGV